MIGAHDRPVPSAAAQRVRDFLAGTLSSDESEETRRHLRECEACAALFDRAAEMERRVGGDGALLGTAARARIAAQLRLDGGPARGGAAVGERREARVPARIARERRRFAGLLATAAAACAIAGISFLLPHPTADEWQARGGLDGPGIGIRVFALEDGNARALAPGDPVTRGSRLGVAYTNLAGFRELAWVAVGSDGRAFPLDEISGAARGGVVDEAIDRSIPVDARFGGEITLHAVFFSGARPSDAEILRAANARSSGSAFAQRTFLLRVTPP